MNRWGFPIALICDSSCPLVRRPAWMRPLSQDLRVRFCRALDQGMSPRRAARMLGVSAATGVRWAQAWRTRGSTQPGKVGGHMRPFLESERDWLIARIEQKQYVTLHERLPQFRE